MGKVLKDFSVNAWTFLSCESFKWTRMLEDSSPDPRNVDAIHELTCMH